MAPNKTPQLIKMKFKVMRNVYFTLHLSVINSKQSKFSHLGKGCSGKSYFLYARQVEAYNFNFLGSLHKSMQEKKTTFIKTIYMYKWLNENDIFEA